MSKWKKFKRKGITEMRPYIPGEDLSNIEIYGNTPKEGDMIVNSDCGKWIMSKEYFEKHFEEIPEDEPICEVFFAGPI